MADESTQISQPVFPANAEAPAAPDVSSATPQAPAVGAPSAPPAPSNVPPELQNLISQHNTQLQKVQQDAQPAPPAAPIPHARLLSMVQGLADGLSAAGTSLATRGREGGAPMVQELQAARQNQKIQASQAEQAKRSEQVRLDMIGADTTQAQINNWLLLSSIPETMTQAHLKSVQMGQEVAGAQQSQAIQGADFAAGHGGMSPKEFSDAIATTAPVAGQSSGPSQFFTTRANQELLKAQSAGLPDSDPYVSAVKSALDPASKATPGQLWIATNNLASQQKNQAEAQTQKSAREAAAANSPVGKLSTPEALAAPGSQAAIQAKIDDPTTDPNDVPRLRALLPRAALAQFNAETIKAREARNQQLVTQGNPEDAGRLLANRSLTLAELKSRQVTPAFIAEAITAAQKYDPSFKAAESEAQSRIAAAPANQQFFGNTDSLLVRGGTLDQLEKAGARLGNTQIPKFNSLDNWIKAAAGSGPVAAYAAAALGVADDYSKVMSGGTGSDTSRLQALDLISKNLSPEGRQAAIGQIRQSVTSQRNGRVGTNPYLRDMYPDPATRTETPGVSGTQAAPVSHQVGDTVTLKNGQTVVIKAINPNGTFNY